MAVTDGVIDTFTCNRTKSGAIELTPHLDCYFSWHTIGHKQYAEVLKSVVRGREYYAAVKETDTETNTVEIYAVAGKIEFVRRGKFEGCRYKKFRFSYYREDENPKWHNCPQNILNLLEEPHSDNARKWRNECIRLRQAKEDMFSTANLPEGSIVEVTVRVKDGKAYKEQYQLYESNYQFKRSWWGSTDEARLHYCPKKTMKWLEEQGRVELVRYGYGV